MVIGKFLRGFVDGSLATLGIVIGASSASDDVIIAAAVGGALANGISNSLSAFSAEQAEQYTELIEVEKAMVSRRLTGSAIERRIRRETLKAGLADGLATAIGGGIPILPYFFLPPGRAVLVASMLVIITLFLVGAYIGKVSKRNYLISALKMAVFGVIVAVAVKLVELIISPD